VKKHSHRWVPMGTTPESWLCMGCQTLTTIAEPGMPTMAEHEAEGERIERECLENLRQLYASWWFRGLTSFHRNLFPLTLPRPINEPR